MGAVDDKEKQAGQAYTRLENSILGHGRIGLPVLGRFLFLGAYPRPIILFVLLFTVPCFAKEVCPNFDKLVQEYRRGKYRPAVGKHGKNPGRFHKSHP